MTLHKSAEDYLETILILQEQYGTVRSIDIASYLGFSKPSVSVAMRKLRESRYITVSGDGIITLTDSGMAAAEQVYRRHKAITQLFVRMGVCPETAALDACKVEHDLSEETFRCIERFVAQMEPPSKPDTQEH